MRNAPLERAQGRRGLKSPLDFGGGLFLLALAVAGFVGAFNLPFGHLSGIGSGLMPKTLAVLVGAFGIALVVQGLLADGDRLEQWAIRGPIFVLAGVMVFAATIRPWGLVVAGPLAVVVAALADRGSRPLEVAILAVVLTLASGLLFKELLSLPIPFDPKGLVPEPAYHAYLGAKGAIVQAVTAIKAMLVR
jgi:hypothetical protein